MSPTLRIGLLGGTFDPVHHGHLDVARLVLARLPVDRVWLLPSYTPPHRAAGPRASSYHRFAMAVLASRREARIEVSDLELLRREPSFTATTLARLAERGFGPSQLFFITGADAFAEIATWRDYPAILERSHFAVVSRPRHPVTFLRTRLPAIAGQMRDVPESGIGRADLAAPGPSRYSILLIDGPTADVSSTDVRQRIASGLPVADRLSPEVDEHIRRYGLYTPEPVSNPSPV
jgi:nicotinate-nucleotide adenylyltransferase